MTEEIKTSLDEFDYDEILIFAVGNTKYDAVQELRTLRKNGILTPTALQSKHDPPKMLLDSIGDLIDFFEFTYRVPEENIVFIKNPTLMEVGEAWKKLNERIEAN